MKKNNKKKNFCNKENAKKMQGKCGDRTKGHTKGHSPDLVVIKFCRLYLNLVLSDGLIWGIKPPLQFVQQLAFAVKLTRTWVHLLLLSLFVLSVLSIYSQAKTCKRMEFVHNADQTRRSGCSVKLYVFFFSFLFFSFLLFFSFYSTHTLSYLCYSLPRPSG